MKGGKVTESQAKGLPKVVEVQGARHHPPGSVMQAAPGWKLCSDFKQVAEARLENQEPGRCSGQGSQGERSHGWVVAFC